MGRRRLPSRLHLLSARAVQTASEGDHSDRGGLLLRIYSSSATWVVRFTAPNGKRREIGLGFEARTGRLLTTAVNCLTTHIADSSL
jgi:hypothetical protein